ncbi:related to mitochondrial rRNA methyltransferase [Rhynchosporium graminicola]|uniref:rRNA methyltransferase 2, mitochondrial n=1 Tax=Rhynchosporium graminicola TaxID=2792576 RepID=A0A1E1JQL1_9HELO|nr:related to mitochondrial rRNA methyltransferase [Rhynchosporium commune]
MLSRTALRAIRRHYPTGSCSATNWVLHESRGDPIGNPISVTPSLAIANTRSSSSSTRWKSRQGKDSFARDAKVQGLKSRAAFKLLEIDAKYRIFKSGQTVVDLGVGHRSRDPDYLNFQMDVLYLQNGQVAVERTKPTGRIVGIDIIPAQPPKGVSTFQGNFLSTGVQAEVKRFLSDPTRGRPKEQIFSVYDESKEEEERKTLMSEQDESYIDHERHMDEVIPPLIIRRRTKSKAHEERMVDVVLSDMSEPWPQTTGFWKRTLSDPYIRMMNTSGIPFKDHAGSMDLCDAALQFARDTLRDGGHFVCKFYQGLEDKELERQLRAMFRSVHREKPESSRSESKEAFFVALRRKHEAHAEEVKQDLSVAREEK